MIVRYGKFITILLLIFVLSSTAFSQIESNKPIPNQIRNGGVGFKVGIINTGKITLQTDHERELDPATSISFGVFFEFKLISRLMISPSFDIYNIHANDLNKFMGDLNVLFKPILYKHHTGLAIKPSFGVGIAHLGPWEIKELQSATTYLSVKANMEIGFFTMAKHAWLLEVGYSAYPIGGNSHVDASIKPSLTVRIGVQY